ncbi:MAG: YihY/virulence factor BrkB family protein, partial [Phaeodactylibacter sp.]|nr:YihY/virulence factor BrkB family protein [Phaeodactylibacter sp.]
MKKPKFDIKELQQRLYNLPIVKQVIDWSMNNSFPGFFKVPIYEVIVFIQNELKRNDLFTRSYAIAYNFFLSIFPSLIAFFTLIPIFKWAFIQYLPEGENFDAYLRTEIQRILPGVTGERLFSFVDDITNNPRFGLLSVGFIFAIYFASNGMISLMRGFDKSYNKSFKSRNAFEKRFIAIGLTFLIGVLLIAAVVLIILGEFLLGVLNDFIPLDQFTNITIQLLRWLAILLVFYMGIALIYRYGAAAKRKFAIFSPGATLATILCIISS